MIAIGFYRSEANFHAQPPPGRGPRLAPLMNFVVKHVIFLMPPDVIYPDPPSAPGSGSAVAVDQQRRYASAVVWMVFAACLAGAAVYISYAGHDLSRYDDGGVLLHLARPVTWKWLWSIHAGAHRLPLVRLIVWAATKVCGDNFTAMLWGNLLGMAALSAAALRAVARLKGRLEITDAVLPLLLLGIGQFFTWTFDFQFQFVATTLILGGFALLMLPDRRPRELGAIAPAALVPLLPLCGANGLLMAAPLTAWLLLDAFGLWRRETGGFRRLAVAQAAGAALTTVIVICYFRGWKVSNFGRTIHPALRPFARTAFQMITIGFGTAVTAYWRWCAVVVAASTILVVGALGSEWARRRWDRPVIAQLAAIVAAVAVCLGVAFGRSASGGAAGLQSRYVTLGLCLPLAVYLAAQLAGRRVRRAVGGLFLVMTLALLWGNVGAALASARAFNANVARLRKALRAGESLPQISRETFSKQIFGWKVSPYLPVMQQLHIGPFCDSGMRLHMQMPVPRRVVRVNPNLPAATLGLTPIGAGAWRVVAARAGLTYRLKKPAYVLGVRIRYVLRRPRSARRRGKIAFWWSAQNTANARPKYDNKPSFRAPFLARTAMRTVWIFGPVWQFHISLGRGSGRFYLQSLALLKPRTLPNLRRMVAHAFEKSAPVAVFPGKFAGTFMFFAPAECRTWLTAPGHADALRIHYGILPHAWTGKTKTAGVVFRIWAGRNARKKLLWEHFDDPLKNRADRRELSATVDIPRGVSHTIVFQTTRGQTPNDNCDWSYWSQAIFVKKPAPSFGARPVAR